MKDRIRADISRQTGGEGAFQGIALAWLPRPHVVFHHGSLYFPDDTGGKFESLSIYPEVLALFRGKMRVFRAEIEAPEVKLKVPERIAKNGVEPNSLSFEAPTARLTFGLSAFTAQVPDPIFIVRKGIVKLCSQNQTRFWFEDIEARIAAPSDLLEIDIRCRSSLWDSMSLNALFNPENLISNGQLHLKGFRPQPLTTHLDLPRDLQIGASLLNLNLTFEMNGPNLLEGAVQGSVPHLTIARGKEKQILASSSLKAAFQKTADKTTIAITELKLDHPQLNLTGRFQKRITPPRIMLELEGRDINVHSTRDTALALADGNRVIQNIFEIVKGGKVPLISFKTHGNAVTELGKPDNIRMNGRMRQGKIYVPGAHMDLTDVEGEVLIASGTLEGKNLAARYKKTRGYNGNLKLGLMGKGAPLHLDIMMQADLSQLPPLLKRWIRHQSIVREINLFENFRGRAKGRLVLGGSTASITTRVEAAEFDLATNYQRLPYPVQISGGPFSYGGEKIEVTNLTARLANCSFSELAVRFGWVKTPYLVITSGKSRILMEELYPWLSSFDRLKNHLRNLEAIKGVVALSTMRFQGPLLKPTRWRFRTTGEAANLTLNTPRVPGPIVLTQGEFKATEATLAFTDAKMDILDAALDISGELNGYLRGLREIDIGVRGDLNTAFVGWLSDAIHMPPELRLQCPLSISQAKLIWNKGAGTSFTGNLVVLNGPEASFDIFCNPEELIIRNLMVHDKESHASLVLHLREKEFSVEYAGKITKTTVDKLFVSCPFPNGWVEGHLSARIFMDQPMKSTVQGKLLGQNLVFPWESMKPLKVKGVYLNARENSVTVESAAFSWQESRMTLKGRVNASTQGLLLDMDISADHLVWDRLRNTLDPKIPQSGPQATENSWNLPCRGMIRLKAEKLEYEGFTWSPFHADIAFDPDHANLTVTNASLCGIATPGTLQMSSQGLKLEFKPVTSDQGLDPTLHCLWDKEGLISGNFDLNGIVRAQGKRAALADSLTGNVEFTADDGRIYRFTALAKIFALLNLTEIFRGKQPDLLESGFGYEAITIKGEFQDGKLKLQEAIIDGASVGIAIQGDIDPFNREMDLTFLVAPFKTIDLIIKHIPLISEIFGGTIVSIPFKVTGAWGDPKVTPLSPSAVGSGTLRMLKRTLNLPIKIIQPLFPASREN